MRVSAGVPRESERAIQGSPPPNFIVLRRGGAHEWGNGSLRFPLNCGVQWSDTVGSTLWEGGGVAVVLDIVLGPVKIAPVAVPAPAGGMVVAGAWSSIYGAVAFGGPCGLGSCMYLRDRKSVV